MKRKVIDSPQKKTSSAHPSSPAEPKKSSESAGDSKPSDSSRPSVSSRVLPPPKAPPSLPPSTAKGSVALVANSKYKAPKPSKTHQEGAGGPGEP